MWRFKIKPLGLFVFILSFRSLTFSEEPGFIIYAGTFSLTNYCVFDVSGSITIQSGSNAEIRAGTGRINLTRSWVNYRSPSAFAFGTSTVTFYDVLSSTITGSTTFYCLVCQTGNKKLFFAGGSTTTIMVNLVFNGLSDTTRIVLRSTSPPSGWFLYLSPISTHTVQFVDVQNSTATGKTVYAYNSVDSGGNVNWIFVEVNYPPYPPYNLAQYSLTWEVIPWGGWINYRQIRASFTIEDPNSAGPGSQLQFNIQFSSYSNFSFLFINSTVPATATLPRLYTTNFINTPLFPEGTWYWRVNSTDDLGLSGPYSSGTAVSGRHFGVDLTSPSIPLNLSPPDNSTTNQYILTFTWSASTDVLSGIKEYTLQVSTSINFTGVVFSSITANTFATLSLYEARFYWRVNSKDNAGNFSLFSTTYSIVIDTTPPPQITDLVATKVTTVMTTPIDLSWTNVKDPSGISKYKIYRSTDDITYYYIADDFDGTPYRDETTTFNTIYYFRIAAVDGVGNEAPHSNTSSARTARCSIDGSWLDFSTQTVISQVNMSSVVASGVANYSEFIFWDKSGEQRNDPNGPNLNADFDLRAVHICADDTHIYFLVRYRDISASVTTYFCISIDTDQISGVGLNIHADDSWMTIGDKDGDMYGGARANHERNIIVHSTSTAATPIIELYASDGTQWYAPPTLPGMFATYLRADLPEGVDGVELKISRSDLGLVGDKIARIIVGAYQPRFPLGWVNDIDTTMDYADRATLDSIAIARLSTGSAPGQWYNDRIWSMNAWDEDISDQDLDFWFDVRIAADGTISNNPPPVVSTNLLPPATNTLTPTLQWEAVTDPDSGDAITSYLVEFDSQPALGGNLTIGATGYRVNVPTPNFTIPIPLRNLTTYYWRVWSRDRCGTLSSVPVSWTVFIDTGPPPVPSLISPANGAIVILPVTLDWSDVTDDSKWAVSYQVQVDSDTSFSPPEIDATTTLSNYTISTLPAGLHYWRVRAKDSAGNFSAWSVTWSFNVLVPKVVDGDPSDWVGQPITNFYPQRRYQACVDAAEWIWTDCVNDNRGEYYEPANYDLTELRVAADTDWIYFLVRVRDLMYDDLVNFAIAIDTNVISGVGGDWIGDNSDTYIGGALYPETASQRTFVAFNARPERNVIFHKTPHTDVQFWTEYNNRQALGHPPDNDGSWYGVAGSSVYFSPVNDCIEARISRATVGLTGAKRARFTFAIFETSVPTRVGWANLQDTTRDNSGPDASDCVAIMIPSSPTVPAAWIIERNEPIFGKSVRSNKWWKDLSDWAIDFWVDLEFSADGIILSSAPPPIPDTGRTPANGSTLTGILTPTFYWYPPTGSGGVVTTYMIEIGKTPDLDGPVDWRINLTSNSFTVPSPGLQAGTTFYWRVWTRSRAAIMTASPIWTVFISSTAPLGVVKPFTPIIDGVMDTGWGTTPTATSPGCRAPSNAENPTAVPAPTYGSDGIQRAVFVTNDGANLYVGYWTIGDVWGGNKAGAVYGFAIETGRNTMGGGYDPWRGHEDISWVYKPEFWVNGAIGDGAENFNVVNLYEYDSTTPDGWKAPETLVSLIDYAAKAKTQRWAEFKLPLKRLGLKKDNIVTLFLTGIPDATGANEAQSYSDTIPFDPDATSAYGLRFDTHTIRLSFEYRICYSTVPATHIPNSEPVVGWGKMRSPLYPTSTDTAKIMIQITPAEIYGSGFVYYSTDSWTTTHKAAFGDPQFSGDSEFRWAEIPKFPRGTVVKYYIEVEANGMFTYLYGTDTTSNRTPFASTAQTNAYSYTVGNAGPSAPTIITLTPEFPDDFSVLSSTASGATDPDGDSLVCDFEWYRNGLLYAAGRDTTVEFSTTVPAGATSPGDEWYIRWRSSDTYGALSDWALSPTRAILGRNWIGTPTAKVNTSTISANEFIWLDKTADNLDSNTDLTEARIYTDSTYIWFLFRLRDITSKDIPFIAITIDTDTILGSGSTMVGDDTIITLGAEYPPIAGAAGYQACWEKQIIFHSTSTGFFTAEITTSPTGLWSTPSSGYFANCFINADIIEARIPRSDLWLVGISTARIAIATFKNYTATAQLFDTTQTDALDSASIIRISTGSLIGQYHNDLDNTMDSYKEDLSDNDIDFWIQLRISTFVLTANTNPPAPSSPIPSVSTNTLTPTLSWTQPLDPDTYDAVTSWLLEFSESSTTLDSKVLYRINVSTNFWRIPENLTGGLTYYWRVSARDRAGYITPSPIWSFYVTAKEPIIAKVYDNRSPNNLDNFGQITGIEDADGTITWDWEPIEPGCTYYIDISTHPEFPPGSLYVTNFSTTSTFYTAKGLTRAKHYYARVKAKNPAGITGPYTVSDGIYVNRIQMDGLNTDWLPIPLITIANSTGIANGIGYWRDRVGSADTRTEGADWSQLDLSTFAIVCDEYNLYMYLNLIQLFPQVLMVDTLFK